MCFHLHEELLNFVRQDHDFPTAFIRKCYSTEACTDSILTSDELQ